MQNTVTTPAATVTTPAAKAAPKAKAVTVATPAVAVQHKAAGAVQAGPQYKLGKMPPVGPASHRGYAQAVATQLASKGTFTLGALRAALVANPLPAGHPQAAVQPPRHGWAKHNMPTWGAGQGWWVLAK